MSGTLSRTIDLVGTITILGLILRYAPEFAGIVKAFQGFYHDVALIDVGPKGGRV